VDAEAVHELRPVSLDGLDAEPERARYLLGALALATSWRTSRWRSVSIFATVPRRGLSAGITIELLLQRLDERLRDAGAEVGLACQDGAQQDGELVAQVSLST